jgi:hypothetical protein
VRNVGVDTAIDVHLRDELPPGLAIPAGMAPFPGSGTYDETTGDWAVGDLAAGTSATLQIPAIITTTDPPDCIVNNAEVSHAGDDNSDNDRAMAAVRQPGIERCVDVATRFFTVGPGSDCGSERTFVVVVDVSNQGTDDASGVVVTVGQSPLIAPNLRFRNSGCAGPSCTLTQLASGETVRLLAESDGFRNPDPRQLRITVEASSNDADFAPENNQAVSDGTLREFSECSDIDVGAVGPGAAAACFIATAAYGSALDPHVDALRRFRDQHLRRSAAGRALIQVYERISPPAARVIARHETMRAAARWLIAPLVLAIVHPWQALALVGMLVAGLAWRRLRRAIA